MKLPLINTPDIHTFKQPVPKILNPGIKITLLSDSQKNKFNPIKEPNKIMLVEKISAKENIKNNFKNINNTNSTINEVLNSSYSNFNFSNFVNETKPAFYKTPNLIFSKIDEENKNKDIDSSLNKIAEQLTNLGSYSNIKIQNFLNNNYSRTDSVYDYTSSARLKYFNKTNTFASSFANFPRSNSTFNNINYNNINNSNKTSPIKKNFLITKNCTGEKIFIEINKGMKANYGKNFLATKINFLQMRKNKTTKTLENSLYKKSMYNKEKTYYIKNKKKTTIDYYENENNLKLKNQNSKFFTNKIKNDKETDTESIINKQQKLKKDEVFINNKFDSVQKEYVFPEI